MNLRAYDSLDQPPDAPEAAKSKLVVPLAVVAQVSELKPFETFSGQKADIQSTKYSRGPC